MEQPQTSTWHFRLYVSGASARNHRTVETLRQVCENHLKDRCEIEIVDVRENPQTAYEEGILATPALIRRRPRPELRIIGELTDKEELKRGLEIDDDTGEARK